MMHDRSEEITSEKVTFVVVSNRVSGAFYIENKIISNNHLHNTFL